MSSQSRRRSSSSSSSLTPPQNNFSVLYGSGFVASSATCKSLEDGTEREFRWIHSSQAPSDPNRGNGTPEYLLLLWVDTTGAHFPFCPRPSVSSRAHCFPEASASPRLVSSPVLSSTEMIQRSIHIVSDCSFSPLCPAVLPHCHFLSLMKGQVVAR